MRGIVRLRSAGMILANFVGPVVPTTDLTRSDADFRRPPVWIARIALGDWFYERVRILGHLDEIPPESAATTAFRRTIWEYPSDR